MNSRIPIQYAVISKYKEMNYSCIITVWTNLKIAEKVKLHQSISVWLGHGMIKK